jgi:hypothetical protein
MTFRLATNLELPDNAITETYGFLGTRGSGKTYGAGKMVEEFHAAGAQVVIVDPVGVWWGLRLAADGRGPGIGIPVFGGWHGDVPLEPTAGSLCAQLVAERGLSVVLDVSEFPSEAAQRRFVTDFARDLFDLKKRNRSPVHIVLEEAHEFLPQQVEAGATMMVGAVKRLWKLGRNFGIGGSLVSQRAAEVNKGALNLSEMLFTGKLKGPQDRKAIQGWAADQDRDAGPLALLPTLAKGNLIAWLPDGAREVRFFPKRTFDASKTPEQGDRAAAQALPSIDLGMVRTAMAATIEEIKANDPKVLRAEIARLRAELAGASVGGMSGPVAREVLRERDQLREQLAQHIEVSAKAAGELETLRQVAANVDRLIEAVEKAFDDFTGLPIRFGARIKITDPPPILPVSAGAIRRSQDGHDPTPKGGFSEKMRQPAPDGGQRKSPSEMPQATRRILTALAQCGPRLTRRKLSILTGYPPGGSSIRNNLSVCRGSSWIADIGDDIEITASGRKALGTFTPLPTGRALIDYWMRELPEASTKILTACIGAYPKVVTRDRLAELTGYPPGGSSIRNNLSKLRGLELVEDIGDDIRAAHDLFSGSGRPTQAKAEATHG